MTKKEILDKVRKHVIEDHRPQGVNEFGNCVYSAPCVIGVLLPPHVAQMLDSQGSFSIEQVISSFPTAARIFRGVDTRFLQALQEAHDGIDSSADFHRCFSEALDDMEQEYLQEA